MLYNPPPRDAFVVHVSPLDSGAYLVERGRPYNDANVFRTPEQVRLCVREYALNAIKRGVRGMVEVVEDAREGLGIVADRLPLLFRKPVAQ